MDFEKFLASCANVGDRDENGDVRLFSVEVGEGTQEAPGDFDLSEIEFGATEDEGGPSFSWLDDIPAGPSSNQAEAGDVGCSCYSFLSNGEEDSQEQLDLLVKASYGSIKDFAAEWDYVPKSSLKCNKPHVPKGDSLLSAHKCEIKVVEKVVEKEVVKVVDEGARNYLQQTKEGCDENTANVIKMLASGSTKPFTVEDGKLYMLLKSNKWMCIGDVK